MPLMLMSMAWRTFFRQLLEEASLPSAKGAGNKIVDLQRSVGFSDSDEPLIHFYLKEAPPLFVWPNGVASRVHVYLHFDDRGLSFLWFSELQELENEKEYRNRRMKVNCENKYKQFLQ